MLCDFLLLIQPFLCGYHGTHELRISHSDFFHKKTETSYTIHASGIHTSLFRFSFNLSLKPSIDTPLWFNAVRLDSSQKIYLIDSLHPHIIKVGNPYFPTFWKYGGMINHVWKTSGKPLVSPPVTALPLFLRTALSGWSILPFTQCRNFRNRWKGRQKNPSSLQNKM